MDGRGGAGVAEKVVLMVKMFMCYWALRFAIAKSRIREICL
jgi:hypothetical protein